MATFHVIWRWRMGASAHAELWTVAQALAHYDGCLRAILVDPRWPSTHDSTVSCHTAAALNVLRQVDPERPLLPASTDYFEERSRILFFDGGSRENPGPGGNGAVVVSTSHHATHASIVWSARRNGQALMSSLHESAVRVMAGKLRADKSAVNASTTNN